MASIDLKDAYYSVPIATEHQKYLTFMWGGKLHKFVCFPNGLAFCPRKFTKLLKPINSHLRQLGHISVSHIDDSYLQGDDYDACANNVLDTTRLLDDLGFIIYPDKSSFIPDQVITILGFKINSIVIRAVARTLIGGCIFIYSGSARLTSFEINFISKETSRARPEYMNIHPPPPPQLTL